jgi:hypothetical protein
MSLAGDIPRKCIINEKWKTFATHPISSLKEAMPLQYVGNGPKEMGRLLQATLSERVSLFTG